MRVISIASLGSVIDVTSAAGLTGFSMAASVVRVTETVRKTERH
jgi:hypothetical protein